MKSKTFDFVMGIIGELIFFIPLILFCIWINQLYPCITAMILLFSYKHLYKEDIEHFDKSIKCISLTYFVILVLVFVYAGVSFAIPNIGNQPVLIILLVSAVGYLNTSVGEIQADRRKNKERLEEEKNKNISLSEKLEQILFEKEETKDIFTLNEEELRIYCKRKGLKARQTDIVVAKVIYNIKGESLEDYMYSLPNNYRSSLRTINRDIVVIKNKLNIDKI